MVGEYPIARITPGRFNQCGLDCKSTLSQRQRDAGKAGTRASTAYEQKAFANVLF